MPDRIHRVYAAALCGKGAQNINSLDLYFRWIFSYYMYICSKASTKHVRQTDYHPVVNSMPDVNSVYPGLQFIVSQNESLSYSFLQSLLIIFSFLFAGK